MMDAETGDLNGGNLDAGDSAAPSEEPEPGLASVHESQVLFITLIVSATHYLTRPDHQNSATPTEHQHAGHI